MEPGALHQADTKQGCPPDHHGDGVFARRSFAEHGLLRRVSRGLQSSPTRRAATTATATPGRSRPGGGAAALPTDFDGRSASVPLADLDVQERVDRRVRPAAGRGGAGRVKIACAARGRCRRCAGGALAGRDADLFSSASACPLPALGRCTAHRRGGHQEVEGNLATAGLLWDGRPRRWRRRGVGMALPRRRFRRCIPSARRRRAAGGRLAKNPFACPRSLPKNRSRTPCACCLAGHQRSFT